MPRNPSQGIKGTIWLPKEGTVVYDIKINGISVRTTYISAEFSKVANPETGSFKITIINAAGEYNGLFNQDDTVQLYLEYQTAVPTTTPTALRFLGYIDKIENNYDGGFNLVISGSHITGKLFNVLVSEIFTGNTSVQSILNSIFSSYLDGTWTLNYSATSSILPVIEWNEKPFWDCVAELCNIAQADCFVDDDKTIYFFDKLSRANDQEAIVWNQTLISFPNLGYQSLTAKNSVKVYGDDGTGLPVIYQTSDTTSQADIGLKELAIFNTDISTFQAAKDMGDANLGTYATVPDQLEGETTCFILDTLNPAEKIGVSNPTVGIQGQYKVYKLTHKFPDENTLVTVGKERKVQQIFKKQAETNLGLSNITNPYKMTRSWNLTFDSASDISSKDANVQIVGGKVSLSSGTQGIFTSVSTLDSTASYVQLKAIGSNLSLITFEISTTNGASYQTLTLEALTALITPSDSFILRVTMPNNTEIDSIAILWK